MRNSWILLSIVGLVSLSVMSVIITYLVRKGLPTVFVLFVLFVVVAVIYGVMVFFGGTKPSFSLSLHTWLLLLAIGILSAIGNLALFKAAGDSPNPGLVVGVVGLQGGLVAALAVFFLKDKLNAVQLFGIVLGIVAIVIMGLGSRSPKTAKVDAEHVPVITDKIT